MIGIRIDRSARRQLVDHVGQELCQQLGRLRWINAQLGRDRADLVRADRMLDLLRRNGFVLAGTHPGSDLIAMSSLDELVQEPLYPAALGKKKCEHGE